MEYHSTYYGCNIYYQPNGMTRWTAYLPNGRAISADTLDGMRRFIRESLGKKKKSKKSAWTDPLAVKY